MTSRRPPFPPRSTACATCPSRLAAAAVSPACSTPPTACWPQGGAGAFTIGAVARRARVPVGSVYHYFEDKEAFVEALALRYWGELAGLVAEVAEPGRARPAR